MKEKIQKVLYTANTHTLGGRDGESFSSDGQLNVKLSVPGSQKPGTNPEQLFAAGWSACFLGALSHAAAQRKVRLPKGAAIDAEVDLGTNDNGYQLQARLSVHLPGLDKELGEELIQMAHQTCPYSKATRDNIDVIITLGDQ